jgi:hypothetical protein
MVCLLVACSSPPAAETTNVPTSVVGSTTSTSVVIATTQATLETVTSTTTTESAVVEVMGDGPVFEIDDETARAPAQVPSGFVEVTFVNTGEDPHAVFVTENSIFYGVFLAPGSQSQAVVEFVPEVTYSFEELLTFTGPPDVEFTASGAASEGAAPTPEVTVELAEYAFTISDQVAAGPHWWQVTNTGEQLHDVGIFQLQDQTLEDLLSEIDLIDPRLQETVVPTWAVAPGQTISINPDLAAGNYALVCRVPDDNNRQRHFNLGMTREVTVEG